MADIRINDLPNEPSPTASEVLPIDGASTRKSTIQSVVNAGAPVATQAKAEAGVDNNDRMTALTTKQSIASEVGVTIASQANGALASTAVQPSRQLIAGSGLTGGGDLSTDRTINVGAGTGIQVNADDISLSASTISRLMPSGGTTSQVLTKNSNSDYDLSWTTIAGANQRIRLTADSTFYVATTGSDTTGDGTSVNPWATIQKAVNTITDKYDLAGFNAIISVANGTYTQGVSLRQPLVGAKMDGSPSLQIIGNSASPASCVISTAGDCFFTSGGLLAIGGFRLTSSGGNCIAAYLGGKVVILGNIQFGSAAGNHIYAANTGSFVTIATAAGYTINGSAFRHFYATSGAEIVFGNPAGATLSGTPNFGGAFAVADRAANLSIANLTISGAATGTRYSAASNAVISTNGAGANYFPGSVAGTTSTGGIYQ